MVEGDIMESDDGDSEGSEGGELSVKNRRTPVLYMARRETRLKLRQNIHSNLHASIKVNKRSPLTYF